MDPAAPSRPFDPQRILVRLLLPFALPILVTLALVLLVGESWPRNLAPGSGLKLAGLGAAMLIAAAVWHGAVRGMDDARARRLAALLFAVTGLMGWPVWTVGVLPSVNGMVLQDERTVSMVLERTETTRKSKGHGFYHWAWLKADGRDPAIASGRFFIPEGIYQDWTSRRPAAVEIRLARGLLGAQVVTGFR